MSRGDRTFLSRWSALKHAGGERPPVPLQPAAELPPPPLPDPTGLTFNDDFTGFLRQEVGEGVKRLALKQLFHADQFNVIDPLDIYIDDYTLASPIDAATIKTLAQARDLLLADPPADVVAPSASPEFPESPEPPVAPIAAADTPAEDPDAA